MKGFYKGVVVGAATSTIVLAGAAAFAATGGSFILGQSNSASSTTGLSANVSAGAALDVSNQGGGTAASYETKSTAAPFAVSSKTKVANLNADMVDGKHASAFLPVIGKAADSDKLDGLDSTSFQARVTGTCAVGHAVQAVNGDGTVACAKTGTTVTWAITAVQPNTGPLTVAHIGPFTLTATCQQDTGDADMQPTYNVATSEAHSAARALDPKLPGEPVYPLYNFDFGPGDPPVLLLQNDGDGLNPTFDIGTLTLLAPDGTVALGQVYAGQSLFGQPSTCSFGGTLDVNPASP